MTAIIETRGNEIVTPAAVLTGILGNRGLNPFVPKIDPTTERRATCDCGTTFTQWRILAAWMAALEPNFPRAAAMIRQNHPDLYTPHWCPHCEREQIRLEANRAGWDVRDSRSTPTTHPGEAA